MKEENKIKIADLLKVRIEQTGKSYEAMGATIGNISAGIINNVVNKKWIGNPALNVSDKMWNRIGAFLGFQAEWVIDDRYSNYKRVQIIANHAKVTHTAHAIISTPGLGKSATLQSIASNVKNVFYLECDEHWSKKVFLNKMKQALGLQIEVCGINEMFDDIIKHLSTLQDPLIIIDEADMLKDNVLSIFVSLYNKTLNHCGFVISGSLYLRARIEKGVRLNRQAYNNIYSRIGKEFKVLHMLDDQNIALLCQANGIEDKEVVQRIANTANNDVRKVKAEIDKIKLEQMRELKKQGGIAA